MSRRFAAAQQNSHFHEIITDIDAEPCRQFSAALRPGSLDHDSSFEWRMVQYLRQDI
jgi:hypothetical protein